MSPAIHARAAIGLALLALVGCRSLGPPLDVPEKTRDLAVGDARADRVLERYLDTALARSALRGVARVALDGPDFELDRPQRVAVERPARLRFEVLGLFDQLAGLLVSDGRTFGFFEASTGEWTTGALRPGLIWELARIDLEPEEAVGVLLGAPLPSPGAARAAVWLDAEDRLAVAFAWSREGPDDRVGCDLGTRRAALDPACFLAPPALREGGEVFVFEPDGRLAELRVFDPGGALRYRARFDDYRPLDARDADPDPEAAAATGPAFGFAHRVSIRSERLDAEARFRWKRVMPTETLSDRVFQVPRAVGSGRGA